jgi:3-mercaptopyruvate sulfurtransferase SseA
LRKADRNLETEVCLGSDASLDGANGKEYVAVIHIVDSQPDVHDYFTEHIPGAYYLNDKALRVPLNGLPASSAATVTDSSKRCSPTPYFARA